MAKVCLGEGIYEAERQLQMTSHGRWVAAGTVLLLAACTVLLLAAGTVLLLAAGTVRAWQRLCTGLLGGSGCLKVDADTKSHI